MADRKTYARIESFVASYPWAIEESVLAQIMEILQLRAEGRVFTDSEIQSRIGSPTPPPAKKQVGAVAVLPIFGVLAHRMNMLTAMSGGMSTEQLSSALAQAVNDPSVGSIVLDVDSPGGSVFGIQELADGIFQARGAKPIIAVANATAASAAYWLASQADEFVMTPSGQVGSIGVVAVHMDRSKQAEMLGVKPTMISAGRHKTDGSDMAPLDEATKADMQRRVDLYYSAFVKAVARGRGVTAADVRGGFGEGRIVASTDAVKFGMVDGVKTLDEVIGRLAGGAKSVTDGMRAEITSPEEAFELGREAIAAAQPEQPKTPDPASAFKLQVEDLRRQLAERGA